MEMQKNRKTNIFKRYDDIIEIADINGNCICQIDEEDFELIKDSYWTVENSGGYIINWRTKQKLHNLIMRVDNHSFQAEVDHINRNKTDNRKGNLRIVNRQINNLNRGLNKNNSSGYKGVAWHKQRGKWRAYIIIDHRQINLGLFDTVEKAYKVRLEKENEILNKLLEDYNGDSK